MHEGPRSISPTSRLYENHARPLSLLFQRKLQAKFRYLWDSYRRTRTTGKGNVEGSCHVPEGRKEIVCCEKEMKGWYGISHIPMDI